MLSNEDYSFNYTFKLVNNITTIDLPYAYDNRKAIKIRGLKYKKALSNSQVMCVKVTSFNNNVYFDGTNITKCVKTVFLPDSIDTAFEYSPIDSKPDAVIMDLLNKRNPTKTLTIEIDIDGAYTGVSSLNPVYIELGIF